MNRLILVGGGHAHVEVLRRLGENRRPDLAVTLVSPHTHSPYSGMLPGLIAGHYTWDQCHIDLVKLCQRAGVELVCDSVTALDLSLTTLTTHAGLRMQWDWLSLNIGSTPDLSSVVGASSHAIPIKPVPEFWRFWERLMSDRLSDHLETMSLTPNPSTSSTPSTPRRLKRIVVVGGGASGVEVALAIRHALRSNLLRSNLLHGDQGDDQGTNAWSYDAHDIEVAMVTRHLLQGHPPVVQYHARDALKRSSVVVYEGGDVVEVTASAVCYHDRATKAKITIPSDHTLWMTGASAPGWLAQSGLSTDERGFVLVDQTLRSVSNPQVMAMGDVASFASHRLAKSGVYAVRQGVVAANNVLGLGAAGHRWQSYRPQRRFLSLISLGDREAIASFGRAGVKGRWVWHLKKHIDCTFMQRYDELGSLTPNIADNAKILTRSDKV